VSSLAATPSHTTGHTGPYPAVRQTKRRHGFDKHGAGICRGYACTGDRFLRTLPEFMTDSEPSGGKAPVDIQMWASDAAGAAFETSFVVDTDPVMFEFVNIGRTDI